MDRRREHWVLLRFAAYAKELDVPASFLAGAGSVRLDFGDGTTEPREEMSFAGMRALLDAPIRGAAIV